MTSNGVALILGAMLVVPGQAETHSPGILPITPWLIDHVRREEGLRLEAYQDTKSFRAIGYGHRVGPTGPSKCSKETAERWLVNDLLWAHEVVIKAVTVPITQGQHDALVSFVYNVGASRFRRSSIPQEVNRKRFALAAVEMTKYVKSDGKVSRGLVLRRRREVEKFLGIK